MIPSTYSVKFILGLSKADKDKFVGLLGMRFAEKAYLIGLLSEDDKTLIMDEYIKEIAPTWK